MPCIRRGDDDAVGVDLPWLEIGAGGPVVSWAPEQGEPANHRAGRCSGKAFRVRDKRLTTHHGDGIYKINFIVNWYRSKMLSVSTRSSDVRALVLFTYKARLPIYTRSDVWVFPW